MTVKKYLAAAGLIIATFAGAVMFGRSANATPAKEKKPDLTQANYYGVAACNKCHDQISDGKPGRWPTDFVRMDEFITWQTKDRHALAYLVLEGPRGQQIGKMLAIDVTKEPQCLNCHSTTSRQDRKGPDFSYREGVSCDGCHGPAQHWFADHFLPQKNWRLKTPEEKEELGMYDLRNPTKRAQLCVSCHVGSASEGKVITHAMYAAGHPPLPSFEVASFSKNLPPHWDDLKNIDFFKKAGAKVKKQNYGDDAEFQHTKLVLATCVESTRSMMDLLGNRATLEGKPPEKRHAWPPIWLQPQAKNAPHDRWPELPAGTKFKAEELPSLWPEIAMAQSDCIACHHDLKSPSWRQLRGYAGRPGRPQFQPWPFALASIGWQNSDDEKEFHGKLKKLTSAFDARPFGVPEEVAAAAQGLELHTVKMLKPTTTVTRETAKKLLAQLLAKASAKLVDYDSARQLAGATRIIFAEWKTTPPNEKAIAEIFIKLDNELYLTLESEERKNFASQRYALTRDLAKPGTDIAAKVKVAGFLAALQKISDEELAASLMRSSEYDPALFKRRMGELSELIFENGAKK